jgi:hypothetical protein
MAELIQHARLSSSFFAGSWATVSVIGKALNGFITRVEALFGSTEDCYRFYQAVEKLRLRSPCGVVRFSKMLTYYVYAALFENRSPCLAA